MEAQGPSMGPAKFFMNVHTASSAGTCIHRSIYFISVILKYLYVFKTLFMFADSS